MRRLESEGFVEVRSHYGVFAAKVSRQDIREIYEVRGLLEAEVVRQVTPRIPDSVLDELDRLLTETQAYFDAGDITKHSESDVCFHDTIANFVENKLLKEGNCTAKLRLKPTREMGHGLTRINTELFP